MNYSIYKCWFKGDTFIKVVSDEFIKNKLEQNNRKKSDLEIHLQKDDPIGYNDYLAELYDRDKNIDTFYNSISYQGTLNEDISIFNDELSHLTFDNVTFIDSKLDSVYFQNLYLVKQMHINGVSKGTLDFFKFNQLQELHILNYNKSIKFNGKAINVTHITFWYFNPSDKSIDNIIQTFPSLKEIVINHTNIENIDCLEALKDLSRLEIVYGPNISNIEVIKKLGKLENVRFENCKRIKEIEFLNLTEEQIYRFKKYKILEY